MINRAHLAVFAPVLLALAGDLYMWGELRGFREMAPFVETEGTVTAMDCANHGNYSIAYRADGVQVAVAALPSEHKRECNSLYVGKPVTVWYSTRDPQFATNLPPHETEETYLGGMKGLTLVWLPLAAALAFLVAKFGNVPLWGKRDAA